ncbi:MAG: 4-deoxy-4-formamido-L-arabinose-phosphoundecaprenol deformylase, partial [Pseudomonadota bacterium]|nr:4-deoxy-4-formamido-L-arabinose-phosphoundecaprenol deformylase [Pseudomonadota bacterium]
DTLRGTQEGVPNLVRLFLEEKVQATFLFSLGPDHTGRAIKRIFRPGFMKKVSRTSVIEYYGIRTLLYGTLLPGPNIGQRCRNVLQMVQYNGFETGIHTYDHILWQDYVQKRNYSWTKKQMQKAIHAYENIFGQPAKTFGAAGWQMNEDAFRLEETLNFDYCSDSRGYSPFLPIINGQTLHCPQLPTTLPTLDELLGSGGITTDNIADHLLNLTAQHPLHGHVYTLHAELEGMKLLPVMKKLIRGWKSQGYHLCSLQDLFSSLDISSLPQCPILTSEISGRSGTLCVQALPTS